MAGGSLVRAQAMVVARIGNTRAEEVRMDVYGTDDGGQKGQELGVVVRL